MESSPRQQYPSVLLQCIVFIFAMRFSTGYFFALFQRIIRGEWTIPADAAVTNGCREFLCSILKVNPLERITMSGIEANPWYRLELPPGVDSVTYPTRPEDGLQVR